MSRNNFNYDTFIGGLGMVAGLIGIGYAIGTHTKLSKISERLDKSISELAGDMEIDIPENIVNKAVDKAVADEAKRAVERATTDAVNELKKSIRTTVSEAVDKEYENLKDSVLKEITDSAAKIDVAKVKEEIKKKAEKAVLDKLDDNMDEILDKFNTNLANTSRIYSSMFQRFCNSNDNTIKLQMF